MEKNGESKGNLRSAQKIFRRMKILAFFMLVWLIQVKGEVYSQNQLVTLQLKNCNVEEFLQEVKNQTGIRFMYRSEFVRDIPRFSLDVRQERLDEVLKQVFATQGIRCRFEDEVVILMKDQVENKMREIRGTVRDAGGNALPGVTVLIKGTTLGTSTDGDGKYSLTLPEGEHMLVFSMIGMKMQEIPLGKRTELNVTMEEDATEMDEVVVTGIFKKAKESYTGSVTTVTNKELKMFRGANVLQTLANVSPAFNIVQNNALGSNPNVLPEVNIRGNSSLPGSLNELQQGVKAELNTPLIIMDGFEISLQKLMDFNDEEIESINLLKDASATAIYGSRGSNGVIVVTTRNPEAGKLKVMLKAGLQLSIPDLSSYDLLNAKEKIELEEAYGFYNSWNNKALTEYHNAIWKDIAEGVNTDWLSIPLRTGVGQTYNLRLEGGTDVFRWSTTLGLRDNVGVMKNSDRKVFDGAIKLQYQKKNLLFQNQLLVSFVNSHDSNYGTFDQYVKMNPYWRPYDEFGKPIKSYPGHPSEGNGSTANPLCDAELNIKDKSKSDALTNNFSIEWTIVDGLVARGQVGVTKNTGRSDYFLPASHSYFKDYPTEDYSRKGRYSLSMSEGLLWNANATLNYSKVFKEKHSLYVGLNYQLNEEKTESYSFVAEGFLDDTFDAISNAASYAKDSRPNATDNITRSVGFTGNANYTYDNRYYVDLSCRVDGGSQFGADKRFAPFWSAGLGWNLHREHFMDNQEVINELRLKFSAGETGSLKFSPYEALAMYNYSLSDRYGLWNGAFLSGFANEDLSWQSTLIYNGGLEIGLWHNRLRASVDVYKKETSNLLSSIALPLASGFSSFKDNVGTVRNTGFEAMLSGAILQDLERGLRWTVTANLTYNKNKIIKLSDAIKRDVEARTKQNVEQVNLLYEGESVNSIYAVPSLGIDPSCGEEIFLDKDNNRTYKWNADSRRLAGNSEPKFRGNISSLLSWKDFSLNLSFAYHWGGQQYNTTIRDRVEVPRSDLLYNVDKRVYTDRWMKPGDIVPFKKVGIFTTLWSSRFVQDDDVFELQSVNLSYRWHSNWLQKNLRMQSILFNMNMNDVFYVSTIKRERGTSYPFARQVTFDISFTF